MNLIDLTAFVDEASIPLHIPRKRTHFDISGITYYEEAISDWYAYFLDATEDHGLESLFVQCLLELVAEELPHTLEIANYVVRREVSTKTRKRIDLLIEGITEDKGKFIIIENKIFHWLHNDLNEYWLHCPGIKADKVGIVLSVKKEKIPTHLEGKFVNVLHRDLVRHIRKKGVTASESIADFYLNEFLAALDNLTQNINMNPEIAFYFDNVTQCNRICDISEKAFQYIVSHIQQAGAALDLKHDGKADHYRYLYDPRVDGACYTIIFEGLYEPAPYIHIIIELYKHGLEKVEELDRQLAIDTYFVAHGLSHRSEEAVGYWMHYASKRYPMDRGGIERLSEFIVEKITADFAELFKRVSSILDDKG